jgi:hypothetical protein
LPNSSELDAIRAAEEAINSSITITFLRQAYPLHMTRCRQGILSQQQQALADSTLLTRAMSYKEGGGTYFMHASSKSKKVINFT